MMKKLFLFVLSLFICGQASATVCYVEFEPGNWSFENDVFIFDQGLEIKYAEGNTDLIGCTVNLPSLNLVNNTVSPRENLEVFDIYGGKLFTAFFDTGTLVDGLRTDTIFYDIDMTESDNTYIVDDLELVLYSNGSKANTFEGNMVLTHVPEPATVLILCSGAYLLRKKRLIKH